MRDKIDDSRGRRVAALRTRHGWTQAVLATLTGSINRNQINKLENGHNQARSAAVVSALSEAFGLTVPQMMDVLDGSLCTEDAYDRRQT